MLYTEVTGYMCVCINVQNLVNGWTYHTSGFFWKLNIVKENFKSLGGCMHISPSPIIQQIQIGFGTIIWPRTGSNPAEMNRIRSQNGKILKIV